MLMGDFKFISCTRKGQIMKFKTFRKLNNVILNINFAIMTFSWKKNWVGRHEDLFSFFFRWQ